MSEYIQPESPLNLSVESSQSEKNSTHNKSISEEIIGEVEMGTKTTQEEIEQTRDTPLEEPSQVNLNIEDVGQTEEIETSPGKDTALGEQNPNEQPSSVRAKTISEIVVPPRKKKSEIKRLRKEQQKLQKLVKRLIQNIRTLKRGKISSKTLKMMNASIQTEFHDKRVTGTQNEPIFIQIDKEQHATITEVATQTKNVHFCNIVV